MRIINEAKNDNTKLLKTDNKKVSATLQKVRETMVDYLTDKIGPNKHKIVDFFGNLCKYVDYYIDNDEKDFDIKGLEKTFSDFLSKTNLMVKDVLGFCKKIDNYKK